MMTDFFVKQTTFYTSATRPIETKKGNKIKTVLKGVSFLCDVELKCNDFIPSFKLLFSLSEFEVKVENCLPNKSLFK